jgi:hypothetical protein
MLDRRALIFHALAAQALIHTTVIVPLLDRIERMTFDDKRLALRDDNRFRYLSPDGD